MSPKPMAILLLAVTGLLVWALWRGHKARAALQALEESLHHAEAAGREQAARLAALEALRDSQQLTEHAIATGTAIVKEMHKGIADIPFSVLEAIPATRAPAKALRGLHDSISEGVYGALAGLNKAVGRELRKGVPLTDPPADAAAATPAEAPNETAAETEPEDAPPPPSTPKGWG